MIPSVRSAADLFDLIQAPIRWRILETGLDLGLFDLLGIPASAEEMAARLDLDTRRLGIFLDAAAAMGLLVKQTGRYCVVDALAPYLHSDGERPLGVLLRSMAALRQGDIGAALRGEGAGPLNMADAAFWDSAAVSLRAFHASLGGPVMTDILESLPVWSKARQVLDLGAGSEVLALTLAERRPDLRITVLDLPPMAERIGCATAAAGEPGRRVTVRAGDYNEVPLGEGYDVIWASMTLYYVRDLEGFLGRVRRALTPGGAFVSLHEGLTAERTAPEEHVVGRLLPALRGQSLSFDKGRIAGALREAGFARVDSRTLPTSFGTMELDVGWTGA